MPQLALPRLVIAAVAIAVGCSPAAGGTPRAGAHSAAKVDIRAASKPTPVPHRLVPQRLRWAGAAQGSMEQAWPACPSQISSIDNFVSQDGAVTVSIVAAPPAMVNDFSPGTYPLPTVGDFGSRNLGVEMHIIGPGAGLYLGQSGVVTIARQGIAGSVDATLGAQVRLGDGVPQAMIHLIGDWLCE